MNQRPILAATVTGAFLLACVGSDCKTAAGDADRFVSNPGNQRCETDADCVVVNMRCAPIEAAQCGYVAMSRTAFKSATWQNLLSAMESCSASCENCETALSAECSSDGLCWDPDAPLEEDGGGVGDSASGDAGVNDASMADAHVAEAGGAAATGTDAGEAPQTLDAGSEPDAGRDAADSDWRE